MCKKYYIISGGFDPIHEGHIAMIADARNGSDGVIVLLNSKEWLCRKKGKNFMETLTRKTILENIQGVIDVIEFDDADNSACDGLRKARKKYKNDNLIFANGGDRGKDNIPETHCCKDLDIELKFGVGGNNKMNSSSGLLRMQKNKISFIIQGEICSHINNQIAEIRKYFPQSPVIVSTCNQISCEIIGADQIIKSPDPGFFYYSKAPGIRGNNVNRQIVSTLAGLKVVKTPYVLKLRTDFRLTGTNFLNYFETQPQFNPDYRIFEHKVLACCYCTRNPWDKQYPYAYHLADISFFGLTRDIIKLFDIPLMTEKEAYWDAENNYFNQYMPEQYIFLNCLRKLGRNPICKKTDDCFPENIAETEQYFTSNFIFLNYKNFNLLPSKSNFFAKNELHSFKTCYTQTEFAKLYNKLQNDTQHLPYIDRERLLITSCLIIEKIAKGIARGMFLFIPIRKIRKTYRPKLAEKLYKIFTCLFPPFSRP